MATQDRTGPETAAVAVIQAVSQRACIDVRSVTSKSNDRCLPISISGRLSLSIFCEYGKPRDTLGKLSLKKRGGVARDESSRPRLAEAGHASGIARDPAIVALVKALAHATVSRHVDAIEEQGSDDADRHLR